jgi:hypothetical protein
MNSLTQTLIAVGLASLLLVACAPGASGQTATETTYTVALDADGDATVTLTYAFTLETTADEAAFDELQADDAARETLAEQFETEMATVADRTAAATNRSMALRNATVAFERTDAVGEAHVRLEWTNLARVDDDGRLTVAEPFSTQFTPDGKFRVQTPPSHVITSVSPEPDKQTNTSAVWNANTSLSGFTLVSEPAAGSVDTASGDGPPITTPGFTAGLAALAVLLAAVTMCRD